MKDKIIEAQYINKSSSKYQLYLYYQLKIFTTNQFPIAIRRVEDGKGFTGYKSISSFLNDWNDIRTVR